MNRQIYQDSSDKWPQRQKKNLKEAAGPASKDNSIDRWQPPERFRTVSLKSIAELLDTTRSSARRWLKEAGIKPIALGRGAKGSIRYKWQDIEAWINSREYAE